MQNICGSSNLYAKKKTTKQSGSLFGLNTSSPDTSGPTKQTLTSACD